MESDKAAKPSFKITTCNHEDLGIFIPAPHNIAFCNDCYFDQNKYQGKTLKKAAQEQIAQLQAILATVGDAL